MLWYLRGFANYQGKSRGSWKWYVVVVAIDVNDGFWIVDMPYVRVGSCQEKGDGSLQPVQSQPCQ